MADNRVGKDRKFYDSHSEVRYKKDQTDKSLGWYFDTAGVYGKNNEHAAVIDFFDPGSKSGASPRSVGFKAIITSFSENYSAETVVGNKSVLDDDGNKTDAVVKFYEKGPVSRNITLSWDVYSAHEKEAEENIKRINTLSSMVSRFSNTNDSDYGKIRMRFANMIDQPGGSRNVYAWAGKKSSNGLEGMITSLSYDFSSTDLGFIKAGTARCRHTQILPQKISVTVSFLVQLNNKDLRKPTANTGAYGKGIISDLTPAPEKPSAEGIKKSNLTLSKARLGEIFK